MAAIVSAATGRTIRHVRVPAGMPRWFAEDTAAQLEVFAGGAGAIVTDDDVAITGRQPRSLDDFALDELATPEGGFGRLTVVFQRCALALEGRRRRVATRPR